MSALPFLDTPFEAPDDAALAEALGQKGALLRRMGVLGAPVPPGFHVPLEQARALGRGDTAALAQLEHALATLAERGGFALDGDAPLCVAVRSSPTRARPGALPTVRACRWC